MYVYFKSRKLKMRGPFKLTEKENLKNETASKKVFYFTYQFTGCGLEIKFISKCMKIENKVQCLKIPNSKTI